ncbi:PAM68 family protein [Calothrix sp. NIES-3974]|uniref:PAM68 family protein n=1 Tax=Calothrix sp. NIES-3974 TaxID=2005462 RepID=UPI000B5FDA34|nr:PAM68 family protein [Calothrix sp. NIES-3974]BAZ04540.1 hypothetical protein NIES3974_11790 [Calothrix sp. NIES-3974]
MSTEPEANPIPFEPKTKRQKTTTKKSQTPVVKEKPTQTHGQKPPFNKKDMAIPEVISQRMIKRVAFFSGTPTILGISTLIISYLLITFAHITLPPIAVLLVNMGFFGLGVLGITYGVLSASWDENRTGTLIGWNEFTTNFGRMVTVWRETRKNKANPSS